MEYVTEEHPVDTDLAHIRFGEFSVSSPVSPAVGGAAVYSNTNRHFQSHEPQGAVR